MRAFLSPPVRTARWVRPLVNGTCSRLRLRWAGGLAIVAMLSPGSLFSQGSSSGNYPAVTIRHAATNEFKPLPKMGAVFSATNHTSQTVSLTAPAVEVKTGSKWSEQGRPNLQSIVFAAPGYPAKLGPHQAGYFVVEFSSRVRGSSPGVNYLPQQPAGTPWRLQVNVQENLAGLADASARVKRGEQVIKQQLGGSTNASMTEVLSLKTTLFGEPVVVVSDEVSTPNDGADGKN